jgi:Rrf2 family protein
MKISTKGEYGIRAMIELTHRYGEGYVQSTVIAGERAIPENYLYQLLITLRKAGLIRSRRGPQGGHMLARAPEDISMAEVISALEGPIEPVLCIQEDVVDDCPFGHECAVRDVWERITAATVAILQATSFAELARNELALRKASAEAASAGRG